MVNSHHHHHQTETFKGGFPPSLGSTKEETRNASGIYDLKSAQKRDGGWMREGFITVSG